MEKAKPHVYLVGEVWNKAEVMALYLPGLPALFNFDLGYAITRTVKAERDSGLVPTHKRIRDYYTGINLDYIDATFLTNHDQNRILSTLNGNLNHAKMAASLLLTLPGAPYLYYGEEIGMLGQKPDPHIREPFLWGQAGDKGRTTAWIEPKYTTPATVRTVQEQQGDPNSLLQHYQRLIQARRSSKAITLGELAPAPVQNPKIISFLRTHGEESVLVLHNLGSAEQVVELTGQAVGFRQLGFSTSAGAAVRSNRVTLPAYSTAVLGK